jgi:hypothetical protein
MFMIILHHYWLTLLNKEVTNVNLYHGRRKSRESGQKFMVKQFKTLFIYFLGVFRIEEHFI